jgi:HSP20 family protein
MLDLKSLVPWGQKSENVPVTRNEDQDPFNSFRKDIDRVFDDFFNTAFGLTKRNGSSGWNGITPRLDVNESDKEIVITAELAGVDEKDLDATLSGDVLTIKGEKKYEHEDKENDRHYVERHYGSFSRSIRLPFEAGDEQVDAKMKNGVLIVKVPKPADIQKQSKRIEVRAA